MRTKDMVTQVQFLDLLINFILSAFIRKVFKQDRRICSLILGVKGLTAVHAAMEL